MAQGKIIVETSRLDSAANKVEQLAGEYKSEYDRLFATVQELKSSWSGSDNLAFTDQIGGFRDDFQRMEKLMRDYATYVRKAAATYRETQRDIGTSVKSLSQGN